jgi:hypothetical protein
VLSKILVSKEEKVTGELRQIRNEELHKLYYLSNIICTIR